MRKDKKVAGSSPGHGENIRFYVEMSARDAFTLLARWAALVGT